ncbi:ABC transporter efflux protein, DrrB family [Mycolicibacterium chubuense NBB4]|uniref:Transport permease protein n=1 Tax=Mycolicibacterium chubuense (strain NBB4) TaxID=710421 RepID=I4BJS2_MYCCN|nr:ABC transporter permease [Mycolicibacterium chubuense]AFM17529.1 ABC transporter efflux protein, DrrB family [Mycolicibacterium chubuense NBB4]
MSSTAHSERVHAPYRPGRHRVQRLWENSPRRLIPQVAVLTARILRRWSRDPATLVQSLVMPAGFLVALDIVFGDVIKQVTGQSGLYGQVPLVALVGGMTGAIIGAIGVMREREVGLLARLWVVPMHRAAGLLARLSADFIRIVVITLAAMCVGIALGFRFEQGILAALVWVVLPAVSSIAVSVAVLTLALYSSSTLVPQATDIVIAILMFFSIGFVPLDQYPDWLQPFVEHQPVSYTIKAMRGLSLEGPIAEPLLYTVLWSAGILAVCAVPLAIGYRRASKRG